MSPRYMMQALYEATVIFVEIVFGIIAACLLLVVLSPFLVPYILWRKLRGLD